MFLVILAATAFLLLAAGLVGIDFREVITRGSTTFVTKMVTKNSQLFVEFNLDPLASGSNVTKTVSLAGANLVSMVFVSDQIITITVNTLPDLTIVLAPNDPYIYRGTGTNPLAGITVATIKFTNASGATANINGFIQHDIP